MPTSSSAAVIEKKRAFRLQHVKSTERSNDAEPHEFLTIESALPNPKRLYRRSHSTLNPSSLGAAGPGGLDPVLLHTKGDGSVHISRSPCERESNPDRISLDRRGLNAFPAIDGEERLRLLSLQHNLMYNLDGLKGQSFGLLVFLDVYDNQLEHISSVESLENLRVLLVGKNRLKKIDGLGALKKIEVLDLHGNQIITIGGLNALSELKVLNLAGNQIRYVGVTDFQGLVSLQELNLRRNRLKKLLGFGETPNLTKLFVSNNDLQSVEDISSLAKCSNLKEISIDGNAVFLSGDCISFLVSYLPHLTKLNTMTVTDQVRKAAMAWRRNKETTNTAFMDLTSDVCLNVRREEVISNARTNWELLRSQTKCLKTSSTCGGSIPQAVLKNLNVDSDLILTSLNNQRTPTTPKSKKYYASSSITKVPQINNNNNAKKSMLRTSSQDTDNSQNSSSNSGNEFVRLPPILVPIIKKMEQKELNSSIGGGSLSSIGPNVDSSVSSLDSDEDCSVSSGGSGSTSSSNRSGRTSEEAEGREAEKAVQVAAVEKEVAVDRTEEATVEIPTPQEEPKNSETTSNLSTISTLSNNGPPSVSTSTTGSDQSVARPPRMVRSIKSAMNTRCVTSKWQSRAATAKPKKQSPVGAGPGAAAPSGGKDREQGGDYLIEICGRHLNVYGQCALRFIDKPWNQSKANDVNTVKFNYVSFNGICSVLNRLKVRFPNIDHFHFKETNIHCLGQLNALAEVQGLTSLTIEADGNPIASKHWRSYAIYRLNHWGLNTINDEQVTEEDVKKANAEYQSLSDLVVWSLPDVLLQPLLVRLRLDVSHGISEQNAKKWLLKADPDLKSVVSKEALQWKKGNGHGQDDQHLRQRARVHISQLLEEMCHSVNKLRLLDKKWPTILHEFVRNALLDYSQLEMYMKRKIFELK